MSLVENRVVTTSIRKTPKKKKRKSRKNDVAIGYIAQEEEERGETSRKTQQKPSKRGRAAEEAEAGITQGADLRWESAHRLRGVCLGDLEITLVYEKKPKLIQHPRWSQVPITQSRSGVSREE